MLNSWASAQNLQRTLIFILLFYFFLMVVFSVSYVVCCKMEAGWRRRVMLPWPPPPPLATCFYHMVSFLQSSIILNLWKGLRLTYDHNIGLCSLCTTIVVVHTMVEFTSASIPTGAHCVIHAPAMFSSNTRSGSTQARLWDYYILW